MKTSLIKLEYRTLEKLRAAYLPFIEQGRLFIACADGILGMGTQVQLQLYLPDQSHTVVSARVVWRVPTATEVFDQTGVGVQLTGASGMKIAEQIKKMLDESIERKY